MDVFIEVRKVYDIHLRYIKAKVCWYNRGYTDKPWYLLSQVIKIQKKDLKHWYPVNELGHRS